MSELNTDTTSDFTHSVKTIDINDQIIDGVIQNKPGQQLTQMLTLKYMK